MLSVFKAFFKTNFHCGVSSNVDGKAGASSLGGLGIRSCEQSIQAARVKRMGTLRITQFCHTHFAKPVVCLLAAVAMVAAPLSLASGVDESDPEDDREVRDGFGAGALAPFQGRQGMVSTASYHATMAGVEALRAGGNAYDAAAVVQFVLTVSEPYASGIGGGFFAVMYDAASKEVLSLDGREEAPRAFSPHAFFLADGELMPFADRVNSGLGVGVPGTVAAVALLLEEHGTFTLEQALQPAIRLAREGFIVTEPFARGIAGHFERLQKNPAAARLFSRKDGTPLQEGDLFRNTDLADTFELLASEGIGAFYTGQIAADIVRTVSEDQQRPGLLTLEDMANYRPVYREPVRTGYRGYEVYGMGMPSAGGTTLGLMLNLLEQSRYDQLKRTDPESIAIFLNVQNMAFADRNLYMADADFIDVPSVGLLAPAYAKERAKLLPQGQAIPLPVAYGLPQGAGAALQSRISATQKSSTTHFSIVDKHRNVVAMTSTIEQHFGSGIAVPGRGFLLNNELTDFDAEAFDAQHILLANAPQGGWELRRTALGAAKKTLGGKRPRSSMSPTILMQGGEPHLVLGSPGGSRITGLVLNVLVNVVDHGMDVQEAINAPRMISRNGPAEWETPLYDKSALREQVEAMGFDVRNAGAAGSVQAIQIKGNWLYGAADPRREGLSLGY